MTSTNGQAKPVDSVLVGSRTFPRAQGRDGEILERVVLVHGSMDRQSGLLKLAKILGNDHVVTTYDRRGYATSSGLSGPFDIGQHVRDLVEVIGDAPALVVGHSFGGTVALACAQRFPRLVRGVVTYENPMPWLEWWPRDTGAGHAARRQDDPEGAAEDFLVRFIGRRLWERLPESTRRARRAEGRALVDELASIHSAPAFERDSISVPVSVGVGSLAKDYMRLGAEHLAGLADSRLVVIDGAHHNAHSARPSEFAERLVAPLVDRVRSGQWHPEV